MRKPPPQAVLKTLPPEKQEAVYEYLATHSLDDAEAWLAADGIETSAPALSRFRSWYPASRLLTTARDTTEAVKEILTELPELNLEEAHVSKAMQSVFEAVALREEDSKLFVALRGLRQADRSLDLQEESGKTKARQKDLQLAQQREQLLLEQDKFKAAIRTKVEAGLAEIAEQVKGNAAAEAALKRLQEAVTTT